MDLSRYFFFFFVITTSCLCTFFQLHDWVLSLTFNFFSWQTLAIFEGIGMWHYSKLKAFYCVLGRDY